MKLSLVVIAAGKQEGKVLEIKLPQFVIGRDPQCHLRPASALISKRHCAILQREGKAYVCDFDSTNGTLLNNEPVKGEVELHHDDQLKIGPLVFSVRLEATPAPVNKPTPPPPTKGAKITGVKAPAPAKPSVPAPGPADTAPVAPSPVAAKQAPVAPAAPATAAPSATVEQTTQATATPDPTPAETPKAPAGEEGDGQGHDDEIAAMLLSLQDDGSSGMVSSEGEVPEGSTVMELPVPTPGSEGPAKPEKEKPKKPAMGNTSSAAKSILEKYMRRPRPTG
jgi:predicted component of type VI protein secretion system